MTEFLKLDGGQLAYDVTGEGELIVLAHGMGDNRSAFRALADRLVAAGHRVASLDQRGQGESSTGWDSYTRTAAAGDIIALIRHLGGGPAVIVGHSFAGGAATIAAAQEPDLVSAVVEIGPFTRAQKMDLGALVSNSRYRKGLSLLTATGLFRSVGAWKRYLDHAYPGTKPAGYAAHIAAIEADLRRPGRMAVVAKMGMSAPKDAGAALGSVRCPTLIVEGTLDPDWADPKAEGEAIVADLPAGLGTLTMIEGAGHYAHAQFPDAVATAILTFLKEGARA